MSENIETPKGWERRGDFLFRQYGESFATIVQDGEQDWFVCVCDKDGDNLDWHGSLDGAIAKANEQLGVPNPVELVETEFADGSVLIHDTENKRWASVFLSGTNWWVQSARGSSAPYPSQKAACVYARAYVRGDA